MARRIHLGHFGYEEINALLFAAWEHGARHVALSPEARGTEVRFLGPDGAEQVEVLSLPYQQTVNRLREMSARFGRVHADMGGHHWHVEPIALHGADDQRLFLHMRAGD